MIPGVPIGYTRVLGKAQGFGGLPIKDVVVDDSDRTPAMISVWQPTPEELAALNAGASVTVSIIGTAHPPLYVGVGVPPEPSEIN